MAWFVLQHVAWEGPGLIAAEAEARGISLEMRRLDKGALLPKPEEVEGLVVMGGPMGAYETDKYPVLAQECVLLSEVVRCGRPVLGVCLGAQLLAKTMGGRVFPGHGAEIGFGHVELTQDGANDLLFGPSAPSVPVFHWHEDTFDLPPNCVLLASSAQYRHQAFRAGANAYGMQFHLEVDRGTWSEWQTRVPASATAGSETFLPAIKQICNSVIGRFFAIAKPSTTL